MYIPLSAAKIIFWDFDGVIKDSVEVKTAAYEKLFLPFGSKIAAKVKDHHIKNGGISRFEKIPLYLKLSGTIASQEKIDEFCDRFSMFVFQGVIDSPWVPGVLDYILNKYTEQYFVIVTATPQEEIEQILARLNILHCFSEVYGAPQSKSSAIKEVLIRQNCKSDDAFFIGDAETDLNAAQINSVPFILRCAAHNLVIQESYTGLKFKELIGE
jgi:phosphoglycolate phosphatase-like HAD superfamily hydrolase